MKFLKKLDARGVAHHFVMMLIVVLVVIGGAYYLIKSHADSVTAPVVFLTPTSTTGYAYNGVSAYSPDSKTTKVLEAPQTNILYSQLAYSHNSRYVAWGKLTSGSLTGQIQIYDNDTGAIKSINLLPGYSFGNVWTNIVWSGDDSKLAFVNWNSSGSNNYQLMTMNADGSGLAVVPNVDASNNNINSLAYTASGQYIVFAGTQNGQQGVFAVAPGQQVTTMFTKPNAYCDPVRSQNGTTSNTVAYDCSYYNSSNNWVSTLLEQTVGSTEIPLYSGAISSSVGTTSTYFTDFAWSPDNSKLAVQAVDNTTTADCAVSETDWLGLINISSPTEVQKITSLSGQVAHGICKGGPASDIPHLAWDAAGANLVYEGMNPSLSPQYDGSLNKVAAALNSTPTNLLPAGTFSDSSWGGGSYTVTNNTTYAVSCSIKAPTSVVAGSSFTPSFTATNGSTVAAAPGLNAQISFPGQPTISYPTIAYSSLQPGASATQNGPSYTTQSVTAGTTGTITATVSIKGTSATATCKTTFAVSPQLIAKGSCVITDVPPSAKWGATILPNVSITNTGNTSFTVNMTATNAFNVGNPYKLSSFSISNLAPGVTTTHALGRVSIYPYTLSGTITAADTDAKTAFSCSKAYTIVR